MKRTPTPPCACRCTCPKPSPVDPPHMARLLELGRRAFAPFPGDGYRELLGEPDEIDEFFMLDRLSPTSFRVLRVQGRPECGKAWVH